MNTIREIYNEGTKDEYNDYGGSSLILHCLSILRFLQGNAQRCALTGAWAGVDSVWEQKNLKVRILSMLSLPL